MGVFVRFSSLLLLVVAAGCQTELPPLDNSTLEVELMQPAERGGPGARLEGGPREVALRVEAFDDYGTFDPSISATLDVYVHYQGSRIAPVNFERNPSKPPRFEMSDLPVGHVELVDGRAELATVLLPETFGATVVWVEGKAEKHGKSVFPLGATEPLWLPDPTVAALSAPFDESSGDAFERGKLHGKQIVVEESRHGARGRLIITGAYSDGFTVSDVACADDKGTPPCVAGDYDHVFVFSYSEGRYEEGGGTVEVGQTLERFGGSVTEFNGLLELTFPQVYAGDRTPHPEWLPEPVKADATWFDTPILFERQEGGLLAVEGGKICPPDDAFKKFAQWKLDIGKGCSKAVSVISKGVVSFDPTAHVGDVVPRVVGTLRPVNIGKFNVWILYPRGPKDVVL